MSTLPDRAALSALTAGPEVLLTMGTYNGTLAALRSLASASVGVVVADPQRSAPARWSRLAKRSVACPSVEREPEAFLEWLLELGAREPGRVLYPSSDDTAWLFSRHRAALERFYRVPVPEFAAVYALLDKWRLAQACKEVGLDVPPTWLPRSEEEVTALARHARFPVLVKPQTQTMLQPHQKGRVAEHAHQLLEAYRDFVTATRYAEMVQQADPSVGGPLVQQLFDSGEGVYSLSGFVSPGGEHFASTVRWPSTWRAGSTCPGWST